MLILNLPGLLQNQNLQIILIYIVVLFSDMTILLVVTCVVNV